MQTRSAKSSATENWDEDFDDATVVLPKSKKRTSVATVWPNPSAITLQQSDEEPTLTLSKRVATPSLTSERTAIETSEDDLTEVEDEALPSKRWSNKLPFDWTDSARVIPLRSGSRRTRQAKQSQASSHLSSSTSSREGETPIQEAPMRKKLKRRSRSNTSSNSSAQVSTGDEPLIPFPPSPKNAPSPPVSRHRPSSSITSLIMPNVTRMPSSSSSVGLFARTRGWSRSKRPDSPFATVRAAPPTFADFDPAWKRPSTATPASTGSQYRTTTAPTLIGSEASRRVSLSDLKIPSRISHNQVKLGQDMERIRDFRKGVEGAPRLLESCSSYADGKVTELKELRRTHESLTSTKPTAQESALLSVSRPSIEKMQAMWKRIEAQYTKAWEGCDVLIELADGTSDGKERERSISMYPRTEGIEVDSPRERQREVLQGILSPKSASALTFADAGQLSRPPLFPAASSPSVMPSSSVYPASSSAFTLSPSSTVMPNLSPFVRPPSTPPKRSRLGHVGRMSINGLRSLLRGIRSFGDGEQRSTPEHRRATSDDEEDEERWDLPIEEDDDPLPRARTHSLASTTPSKRGTALPWPIDAKLELSTEAMPMLIKYLTEVQEGCRASLRELRETTL